MEINKKIIAREIHNETVLLNKENGDYFSLNAMGTEIYRCICNGMDIEEIINFLFPKYEVEFKTFQDDVQSLILELEKKNIIVNVKTI